MEELIRQYLKNHLSIKIKEVNYGFNGSRITIELKLDDEIISEDSYTMFRDEG